MDIIRVLLIKSVSVFCLLSVLSLSHTEVHCVVGLTSNPMILLPQPLECHHAQHSFLFPRASVCLFRCLYTIKTQLALPGQTQMLVHGKDPPTLQMIDLSFGFVVLIPSLVSVCWGKWEATKAGENLKLYSTGQGDGDKQVLHAPFYASPILQNQPFKDLCVLGPNIFIFTSKTAPTKFHACNKWWRWDPSSHHSDLRNDLSCKEFYPKSLFKRKQQKLYSFVCYHWIHSERREMLFNKCENKPKWQLGGQIFFHSR